MVQTYNTDNRAMRLYITIKCKGERSFYCFAEDTGKKNSMYARREIKVNGSREIYFSMPITPKQMTIGVLDSANRNAKDFEVTIAEAPIETYNIWMDSDSKDFMTLVLNFAQRAGFEPALESGRVFQTQDGKFTIKYFPVIKDFASGQALSTPARIGHKSGIIDNSKIKFDRYTIPMRVIIDLHEFSHKYKNPKMGLPISNEIGADINALYIYLGLGFSKVDAIYVFANVFLKAQTPQNIDRMRKIMDYIQRFENEEFAERNGGYSHATEVI